MRMMQEEPTDSIVAAAAATDATLLARVKAANSQQEQLDALNELQKEVAEWKDRSFQQQRESLATNLLQQVCVVGFNAQTALHSSLEACGPTACLTAACQTLKDIANGTCKSSTALEASLRILQQLLCVRPKTSAHVWVEQLVLTADTADIDTDAATKVQHNKTVLLVLQEWTRLLVGIPHLVANACHASKCGLKAWAVHERYRTRLMECAATSMVLVVAASSSLSSDDTTNDDNDTAAAAAAVVQLYFQLLIQRMVRTGGLTEVTTGLHLVWERLSKDEHENGKRRILTNGILETHTAQLSPRESALVCRVILLHAVSLAQPVAVSEKVRWENAWCESACLPIMAASSRVRNAVVRLLILSPTSIPPEHSMDRLLCHGVASLLSRIDSTTSDHEVDDDEDDSSDSEDEEPVTKTPSPDQVLRKHLTEATKAWSQTVFVRQTDRDMQRHVTNFVLSGMQLLSDDQEYLAVNLSCTLLEGVTARLHSNIESIRTDGMLVGECLAKRLGQELRFDELDGQRQSDSPSLETRGKLDHSQQQADDNVLKRASRRPRKNRQLDPDAEYVSEDEESNDGASSSSEFDDDSMWDDEDVGAYDLEDDEEDLLQTPRPLYLSHCIELLRTPEKEDHAHSKHETALKELSSLVRAHPLDLQDYSESITMELLRLENKYNTENFVEMVVSSLVALAVEDPLSVCATLVAQMFMECSHFNRLTALAALSTAALELSGEKQLAVLSEERARASPPGGPKVSGKRHLVGKHAAGETSSIASYAETTLASDEPKTRRWGRRAREHEISNRFGKIAPVWFYTLFGSFMESRDNELLWGGEIGSKFLARTFVTLASFVEASGNCPGTDSLAKDLFQTVWAFRDADIAEVRMAVLCAAAASVKVLRGDALMDLLFNGSMQDMPQQLQQIAFNDGDESCRNLAKMIGKHVATAARSVSLQQERSTTSRGILDF